MDTLKQNIPWILLIAAVLLFVGCFPLPMGYYTFMRIVVCAVAVLAIVSNKAEGFGWRNVVLALIAILFNPIIPIHFYNNVPWVIIDLLCVGWFAWLSFQFKKANNQ